MELAEWGVVAAIGASIVWVTSEVYYWGMDLWPLLLLGLFHLGAIIVGLVGLGMFIWKFFVSADAKSAGEGGCICNQLPLRMSISIVGLFGFGILGAFVVGVGLPLIVVFGMGAVYAAIAGGEPSIWAEIAFVILAVGTIIGWLALRGSR